MNVEASMNTFTFTSNHHSGKGAGCCDQAYLPPGKTGDLYKVLLWAQDMVRIKVQVKMSNANQLV